MIKTLRTTALGGLVVGAALLFVPTAGAAVYCVNNPACPGGGISQASLEAALATAEGTTTVADEIDLGPGTFTDPTGTAFTYDGSANAANDLTIKGAGPGATTITQTQTNQHVLAFVAGADYIVRDLAIALPPLFTNFSALQVPTSIDNVRIVGSSCTASCVGLRIGGFGAVTRLRIELPLSGSSIGIVHPNGSNAFTDLAIAAANPFSVSSFGSNLAFKRVRIDGGLTGLVLGSGLEGTNSIEDAQIRVAGAGPALENIATTAAGSILNASEVTLQGGTTPSDVGVASTGTSTFTATTNLHNAIINGFDIAITSNAPGGSAASLTVTDSVLPFTAFNTSGNGTVAYSGPADHNADSADAHLVDAGGDLFPRYDSPAIDHGAFAFMGDALDLRLATRPIDGNGDATVAPDSGAVEYQRRAPVAGVVGPTTAIQGSATTFAATGSSDPDPGDTLTFSWRFSDGGTATGAGVAHTFAKAGAASAELTVTDPTGLVAKRTVALTVKDARAPKVTKAAVKPKRFKRGRGTTFSVNLSETATVKILIERKSGRRYRKAGTLTKRGLKAGTRKIKFRGKFGRKTLATGSYRATIVATDAAGNKSKRSRVTFKVLPR